MTVSDTQPILRTDLDRALIVFLSRSAQSYQSTPKQRQALITSFQVWMGLPATGQSDPVTVKLLALANRYIPSTQTERNLLIFLARTSQHYQGQDLQRRALWRFWQAWQKQETEPAVSGQPLVDPAPADADLLSFLQDVLNTYTGETSQRQALTLYFQTWAGLTPDGELGPETEGIASLLARYVPRDATERALLVFLIRSLVAYRSTSNQRQALVTYGRHWLSEDKGLPGVDPLAYPPLAIPDEIPKPSSPGRDSAEAARLDFLRATTQLYDGDPTQFAALVHYFQIWTGLEGNGQLTLQTQRALGVPDPLAFLNPNQQPLLALTQADCIEAAALINVEPAALRTVADVESNGTGYLSDGRLKILFEGQVFWQELQDRGLDPQPLALRYPSIVYKTWTPEHYLGGVLEYSRLELAMQIHPTAALNAASWGMFQIMGFNHAGAGFSSVEAMVGAYARSVREQLISLARWLRNRGLDHLLNVQDWAEFARAYNGEGYAQNHYDLKLAERYQHWKSFGW
ncbi:N-acetylmuramidase family protein [Leptolyngbya sp. FACHB-261]|uniref:N-acetylmuramidase family protein n=1 Tax=Leptolyngbya sp. FACHB-261 TaxID=2692806 RepID=UPI0016836B4E|nr:N-acetylmuramidase family protein [Leptolyngbya sp. FACHB-261]MBD2102205.1 N-acetylmuramidase family protein [Leptolyngbya sp. FACHB-261]